MIRIYFFNSKGTLPLEQVIKRVQKPWLSIKLRWTDMLYSNSCSGLGLGSADLSAVCACWLQVPGGCVLLAELSPLQEGPLESPGSDHCDVPGVNFGNEGPYPACGVAEPPGSGWQAGKFDVYRAEIELFQVWQKDDTF